MLPQTCFTLLFFFANLGRINPDRNSFCKTSKGEAGKCLHKKTCQISQDECGEDLVCCPMLQKIVTPDVVTPYPVGPPATAPPPVSPLPFPTNPPPGYPGYTPPTPTIPDITIRPNTPSLPSGSKAALKCEEYKHRIKRRSSIITYVFGGSASLGKEFPHMAILGYGQPDRIEWLCGGSLISDQFVVTAAHCLNTPNLGQLIRVRLGDLDLQSVVDDALPQEFGIAQKIIHPNYHLPSQYNDIALLRLDRPAQFSDYVAPICLEVNKNLPNTNFIATGWGRTELGGSQSDILMKVDLSYFPNNVCQRTYADISPESLSRGIVDDIQICAGSYQEDKDTCQGDSGGPLQIRDDTLYLVGITSFGRACGVANSPAVYTRVSYYVPWIEQIVWP